MTETSLAQDAWRLLEAVPDPEIPVVSIRELGILREVNMRAGMLEVVITPTYSGCPAMGQIEDDVRTALAAHGLEATVVTRLAPAWTTDWMTDGARDKLRAYGIAPPRAGGALAAAQTAGTTGEGAAPIAGVVRLMPRRPAATVSVPCPRCGSDDTTETSHFGSTACKALYRCLACLEPFDYFKPY